MAAALGPLQKVPIQFLRNMPIRPTKNAHPTYEKCPSDLRKMPMRMIKNITGHSQFVIVLLIHSGIFNLISNTLRIFLFQN